MLIVCPNCDASFELDSSLLEPSGRALQCSECAHKWFCGTDGLPAKDPNPPAQQEEQNDAKEEASENPTDDNLQADLNQDQEKDADVQQNLENTSEGEQEQDIAEALSALDDESDDEKNTSSSSSEEEKEAEEKEAEEAEEENEEDKESKREKEEREEEEIEAKIREHEQKIKRRGRRRRRSGAGTNWFGWLLFLAFCGGGVWASYQYRAEVVAYYPSAAEIYQRLGWMRPLGEGLKIIDPRIETRESANGDKSLLIVGEIYNTLTGPQNILNVPLLRGALIDGNDREVRVWIFQASRDRILPNERIIYETELGDPPSNVRALKITFARPGED